jgi:hypothetical protein
VQIDVVVAGIWIAALAAKFTRNNKAEVQLQLPETESDNVDPPDIP